jgi:hypothetical protein
MMAAAPLEPQAKKPASQMKDDCIAIGAFNGTNLFTFKHCEEEARTVSIKQLTGSVLVTIETEPVFRAQVLGQRLSVRCKLSGSCH